VRALEEIQQLSGDNRTDCINRALQICAAILKATEDGRELLVKRDGEETPLRIIL